MNLRTRMRVGDVTRWHIVRTARQQTLAEHLYKTCLLATEYHRRLGLPASTIQHTAAWALEHDLPEVLIGDMPTPVKRAIEQRSGDIDIWKKLERDLVGDSMMPSIQGTPVAYVVKVADCLEGWAFLLTEGVGAHALDVKFGMLDRARGVARSAELIWPDYRWGEVLDVMKEEIATAPVEHCR